MIKQDCVFKNEIIENMKDLKHLRIIFSSSESIKKAQKIKKKKQQQQQQTNNQITKQTMPCTGSGVARKIKQTVDCQLDLFDKVEMPVLLYGCKV